MGIMTFLREKAGFVLIGLIVLSIIAFLVSDASRMGGPLFKESNSDVAVINGNKISVDQFNRQLQAQIDQSKQQYGGEVPPQMAAYLAEQTWNQLISQTILGTEVEKAGLSTGSSELNDMVLGKNPDPRVKQTFTDRKTGTFDPSAVSNFIRNLGKDTATKGRWISFERELVKGKTEQKYLSLIQAGIFITNLEISEALDIPEKRSGKYTVIDYSTVADAKAVLSESEIEGYYSKNRYKFQAREDTRNADFVSFEARPSAEDSASIKKEFAQVVEQFKSSKNDSLFVGLNAETKGPLTFFKRGRLPGGVDSSIIKQNPGFVLGPYFQNGVYKAAKLVSIKQLPDSVRSRHMLLTPAKNQPIEEIQKLADSLRKKLLAGADFSSLAKANSADKGSASKGGDLGFIAMGQGLVKPFEDAIFNGKKGDIKIVQTQFGIHLIEIVDQKNVAPAYQIALVDRALVPSNKTVQVSFASATRFVGALRGTDLAAFEKAAGENKVPVRAATDIKGGDQTVSGIENARKLVQWMYAKKTGEVSEVIDLGNRFVIARLSSIRKKGYLPLSEVRRQVEADALKEKKGIIISTSLRQEKGTLEEIAKKNKVEVLPVDSVSFSSSSFGKTQEPKVVGAIFGLQTDKTSRPVSGDRGVYLVKLLKSSQQSVRDLKTSREKFRLTNRSQAVQSALEALKDKAVIVDHRGTAL